MRGELNIRNVDTRTGLGRGIDLTAPSTPGTASSMRTNPPSYQRMHSNDSNKDLKDGINNGRISDWLDNHNLQRLRNATGKTAPAYSKRLKRIQNSKSPIKSPLVKPNTKYYVDCNTLSASNPLDKRSHSLEGFLDSSEIQHFNDSTENLDNKTDVSTETSYNRRSKSLDDLFNDNCVVDETKSIASESNCEQELLIVDNSMIDDHEVNEQNNSLNQDLNILNENNTKNSFLDRYFKKVKKLIK